MPVIFEEVIGEIEAEEQTPSPAAETAPTQDAPKRQRAEAMREHLRTFARRRARLLAD